MNMIDQARGWLARSLYRGLTRKGVAGPIIPEWVQHNFLEPTWRSIIREGYKANSAFFSCVSVWAFAFPEPRLKVYDESGASPKLIERHPLYTLLNRPADYLSQGELWQIAITYALVGGKAFLWKRRTVGGEVRQLIPYHAGQIQAQGKSDPWPTHYTYTNSEGRIKELGPEEVIYLRWMIDPDRPWDGMAPAVAAARDVDADTEAARYMYTLLKNDAIPRVALTLPPGVTLDDDQWARQQNQWQDRYGEGKRGMAAILEGGMDVKTLSLQMDQLAFDGLRRIPETRMCAACRVPAILAGVAAGLERCLPADARVWTTTGPKNMGDVRVGDTVWSFVDGGLQARRVTAWGPTGVRKLYRIKAGCRTLRATDNHPILVRVPGTRAGVDNGGRHASYAWKRVDELQVGDYVVAVKSLPDQGGDTLPDGTEATPEMLQFLGAIIGDGTVRDGYVAMAMPPDDRCGDTYRRLASSLFTKYRSGGQRPWKRAQDGNTPKMIEMHDAGMSYKAIGRAFALNDASVRDRILNAQNPKPVVTAPVSLIEGPRSFQFRCKADSKRLVGFGFGKRAATKRIPGWVYALRRDLRLAFLAGLVDTDGSVDKRGVLTFCFCNEDLTRDIRDLCMSVGLQCSDLSHRVIMPDALPNKGTKDEYHAWAFVVAAAASVAEIPFADPLYRERVESSSCQHKSRGWDADRAGLDETLGFYRIRSIEPAGEEMTYDLEVAGAESFVAESIVVHNSTFSNTAEARLMFTQDSLVPMWRYFAAEMTSGLRQDGLLGDNEALEFDTSQVNALAEAQAGKMDAFTNAVRARWVAPNEARAVIGLPPIEGGDVLQPEPQPMIQLPQAPGKRLLLSPGAVKAAGDIHTWYGFTDADLDEAEETFDEALPDVAGLLSAEVEDE
jgi:HK97 family phage portal protein